MSRPSTPRLYPEALARALGIEHPRCPRCLTFHNPETKCLPRELRNAAALRKAGAAT